MVAYVPSDSARGNLWPTAAQLTEPEF